MTKQFRDFESAREFARSLNLKSQKDWFKYCKSGNKPDDIPRNANTIYKNYFKGYGDWLGTGTVHTKQWRSFTDAREFARALNLKGNQEWREYCKSGNKPDDIPTSPDKTYKNKFKGYGDWLDNEKIYRSYKEAREFAKNLGLKSKIEWQEYCKSGDKPDDIPATPWNIYKEWSKK